MKTGLSAGDYYVRVNTTTYGGTWTNALYAVLCKPITSITSATVILSPSSYTYDGKAKKSAVTVKLGSKTLAAGTDYDVSYANNTAVGTATVTVTGRGDYAGTAKATFAIAAAQPSGGSQPAASAAQAMHRLYNPNSGEHFYTTSASERDNLVGLGWKYEGIGWYSDDAKSVH